MHGQQGNYAIFIVASKALKTKSFKLEELES